ncbi:hypothetical protein WAI453_013578 [Rhynchosporium graminicola]
MSKSTTTSKSQASDALVFTSRCLLEVHERVDDLRNLQDHQRYGVATSPLSQDSLDGRLHDVEERIEALEQQSIEDTELRELLNNIKDELEDKIETVGSDVSDLDRRMQSGLLDLEGRVETGFTELQTQLDIVGNAIQIQRNSIATRLYSTYWKCHDQKYFQRLTTLLTFYSIDLNNWYNTYSDTDSDDDSTDLNHPQSEPSSIRETAQRKPKRAVMALFSHLGLPYHVFEDQIQRPQVMLTGSKRGKDAEIPEMNKRQSKQRYVGRDGGSFLGSPTDISASPTQSVASGGETISKNSSRIIGIMTISLPAAETARLNGATYIEETW